MPIPSDPIPYLLFEEEFFVFESGCNDIEGRYRIDEGQLTIEMGLLRGVGCADIVSSEATDLEIPFQSSLSTWETYLIEGNDLSIQFGGGEIHFSNLIPSSPLLLDAFPFQDGVEEAQGQETQSVEGELKLVDGCLRVVLPEADEQGYLIIWRSDHAIGLEEDTLAIYDTYGERMGEQLARVGNQVSLRGKTFIEQDELKRATSSVLQLPPPAECPGPYLLLERIK